ncbi:unnamed protein product [Camellia sinensis]
MSQSPLTWSRSSEEGIATTTAIAIGTDKNSQFAVKWAVDNLLKKNSIVILVHVKTQSLKYKDDAPRGGNAPTGNEMQQLFLPYRGFCARKGVLANEMVLHDIDISNALVDFIQNNSISTMILGASSRSSLTRAFRNVDVPTSLCKIAPNFCSVYVISKGKVQSIRSASQPSIPGGAVSSKRPSQTPFSADTAVSEDLCQSNSYRSWKSGGSSTMSFDRNNDLMQLTSCDKLSTSNSIVPSPQHSTSRMISSLQHPMCNLDLWFRSKGSSSNQDSAIDVSDFSGPPSFQSTEMSCENLDYSLTSDVSRTSGSSQTSNELEAEMRRLRDQLKQMMEMYNSVCKEAISSKEKAKEIDEWKPEEERKVLEAKQAQEAAMALAEMEKQKTKVAIEAALMAQRLAKYEIQMRKNAEMKAIHEIGERKKAMDALTCSEIRYRKYPIEEIEVATDYFSNSLKIGEGGYGPVYKAFLDHTPVAIKVLRPDMSQGKKQFQREVEVLSYIRHPNMVLLLGACPEYGCLVYEHMENGSLEDRLFRKNNSPPLPWKTRFRISAEVATALLFLHRTKPEPLVHRDLKPANILLNRNYVSKISDVGLARLVPPSVANGVTQYQMTAAAGTFCYIDPEYQQTGLLGVKSDVYSLGVILLQIITARPPIGLSYHVGKAIERGTFSEILDPMVPDWPFEEALSFAKLAFQCCELRRRDRPDLGSIILPELQRLSNLGFDNGAGNIGRITYGATFNDPCFQVRSPFSEEARRRNCIQQIEIQERSVLKEDDCRSSPEPDSEV